MPKNSNKKHVIIKAACGKCKVRIEEGFLKGHGIESRMQQFFGFLFASPI